MTRTQITRLPGLLWMLYKPSELADELHVSTDTLYKSWIPAGAPHRRDPETGAILIVGTEFAEWARRMFIHPKAKLGMSRDQAFCFKCQAARDVANISIRPLGRGEIIGGTCAVCGAKVSRGRIKSGQS